MWTFEWITVSVVRDNIMHKLVSDMILLKLLNFRYSCLAIWDRTCINYARKLSCGLQAYELPNIDYISWYIGTDGNQYNYYLLNVNLGCLVLFLFGWLFNWFLFNPCVVKTSAFYRSMGLQKRLEDVIFIF